MSKKIIVFDFGNVIGMFSHLKAASQLVPFGPKSVDFIRSVLFDKELEHELESGNLSPLEFRARVRNSLEIKCSDEDFDFAFSDMFTPNDLVCAMIPRLAKEHKLILLSNTNWFHARRFTSQFAEVLSYFDTLILSHEVRCRKPNRMIYDFLNKSTNTNPTDCLFIDDLHANIQTAKDCGWNGIIYHPEINLEKELASHGVCF